MAGSVQGQVYLTGIDRHGHLTRQEAALSDPIKRPTRAMVGTDAALGIFDSETELILKDGIVKSANEIVEQAHSDEIWFENVITCPSFLGERNYADSFVSMLIQAAPFTFGDAVALRCRSRDVQDWETVSSAGWCRFHKVASDVFCLVTLSVVRQLKGLDLCGFVRSLSRAVWRNSEEGCEEFDCLKPACSLWYASALQILKVGHLFKYDGRQHSLLVRVIEDHTSHLPLRKCGCAFLDSDSAGSVRLSWTSGSWKPIGSGFLISGR